MKRLAFALCIAALLLVGCNGPAADTEADETPIPAVSPAAELTPAAQASPTPEPSPDAAAAVNPDGLAAMLAHLEWQYTKTGRSSDMTGENMGYLFALKAIRKAVNGEAAGQEDGGSLTYAALAEAYAVKLLSGYCPFGPVEKSAGEQYGICAELGLLTETRDLGGAAASMQTGDLMFWEDASGSISHVGMFFRHEDDPYIIGTGPGGIAQVSEGLREDDALRFAGYARVNRVVTATFQPAMDSSQLFGRQKVLFNCPAAPPEAPARNGYVFVEWQPSVSAGMRQDTTYVPAYAPAPEGGAPAPTPAPGGAFDFDDPDSLVLERTEDDIGIECETVELGVIRTFTEDSVTYEKFYRADIPDWGPEIVLTGEFVTLKVDAASEFWTLGLLDYFALGKVSRAVFAEWLNKHGEIYMKFYAEGGALLMGVEQYIG